METWNDFKKFFEFQKFYTISKVIIIAEVQAGRIAKQNCIKTKSTFLLFPPFQHKKKK
jgi:hypothetical protein